MISWYRMVRFGSKDHRSMLHAEIYWLMTNCCCPTRLLWSCSWFKSYYWTYSRLNGWNKLLNDSPRINNEEHGSNTPKLVKGQKQDFLHKQRSDRELEKEQKQEGATRNWSNKLNVTQIQNRPCLVPMMNCWICGSIMQRSIGFRPQLVNIMNPNFPRATYRWI